MPLTDSRPDIVVVFAPVGADGPNICQVLKRAGLATRRCIDENELQAAAGGDCGAILLTEEALTPRAHDVLAERFSAQPPWSDIPLVLIAREHGPAAGSRLAASLRGPGRTVTLLERPMREVTLLATMESVLAARHRQYEIRDLLQERDHLLNSLEARVSQRTAELRGLLEEMEAFSYSVSHDLRSPLRSLAGYARALQEDHAAELSAPARAYLDKITRAAQRMDNLTQDILAYTRITQGEMEIVPVDLDALVADVIEQYPALGSSASHIHVRAPLGRVFGHVPSLVQCFSNLLGNATKFIPAGRVPEIVVSATQWQGWCRVTVRDNGVGIDPVHHQRIFGMFERASAKDIPGTGIGLAIVKKAIDRMGGTVGVKSMPGLGAEFWFELRSAESAEPVAAAPRSGAHFWNQAGGGEAPITAGSP